jgi:cytochrome c5
MRYSLLFLAFVGTATADEIADARQRWAESPHGPLLERILPPTYDAAQLPEPDSRGAKLVIGYCVQCHNLPNPAMHDAARWPGVVARMVPRMEGKGNLGKVMADLMAGVRSPSEEEARTIVAYLRKYAQKPIDPARYPDLYQPSGEPFRLACNQCHTLPDPLRYNARQWPAVVARMQENMEWMNRVVGSKPLPGEPQLRVEDILAFLEKHARR